MNSKFDLWLIRAATRRQGIARDVLCQMKGSRAWRPYAKRVARTVGLRLVVAGGKGMGGRAVFYFMPPAKAARFA